jgi:hypothetical protein
VQTLYGEVRVEIPQVREAAEPFVSKPFPRGTKLLRSEPLRAVTVRALTAPEAAFERRLRRPGRRVGLAGRLGARSRPGRSGGISALPPRTSSEQSVARVARTTFTSSWLYYFTQTGTDKVIGDFQFGVGRAP